MTNPIESNYKLVEAFGMVLLNRLEAEFVTATYEMTKWAKQMSDSTPWLQNMPSEQWSPEPTTDRSRLSEQIAQLTEELKHRNQAMTNLESRVAHLENFINQQAMAQATTPTPDAAVLESRLAAIEESLSSIDLLATELGHRGATTAALDSRVSKLEASMHDETGLASGSEMEGNIESDRSL
jgi:predicted  nucleic acid-binding Zn-ribbon protein